MHKEGLFAFFPDASIGRYTTLIRVFGTLEDAWHATPAALQQTRWPASIISSFIDWRKNIDAEKITADVARDHIRVIAITDPEYPPLLRDSYDPPFCIFVRGNLSTSARQLAVVGPRKHSDYAAHITRDFTAVLAKQTISIISGLALGIDAIAHKTTLQEGGHTIAVLPGGINTAAITPRSHLSLANDILEHGGALVSEHIPNAPINTYSFPQRNRIIAALSHATLVVEAGRTSGALLTANYALDYGREVFAVPQNVTSPTSVGVNTLIANGAQVVQSATDIINAFGATYPLSPNKTLPPTDTLQHEIYQFFRYDTPIHIDELIQTKPDQRQKIISALPLMELNGHIRHVGGMHYVKQ